MKKDGAICVLLLPAKHNKMGHGSCTVRRGSTVGHYLRVSMGHGSLLLTHCLLQISLHGDAEKNSGQLVLTVQGWNRAYSKHLNIPIIKDVIDKIQDFV